MITIGAIPDPTAMGLEVQADVMIEVEPGMVETVAVALGDYDEVGYLPQPRAASTYRPRSR